MVMSSSVKVCSHCDGNGNDLNDGIVGSVHTKWTATATEKLHICVFALFLALAVSITKWVHNPFANNAIASTVAISHNVNTSI